MYSNSMNSPNVDKVKPGPRRHILAQYWSQPANRHLSIGLTFDWLELENYIHQHRENQRKGFFLCLCFLSLLSYRLLTFPVSFSHQVEDKFRSPLQVHRFPVNSQLWAENMFCIKVKFSQGLYRTFIIYFIQSNLHPMDPQTDLFYKLRFLYV